MSQNTISSIHWMSNENGNWTNENNTYKNHTWTNENTNGTNGNIFSSLSVSRNVEEVGYGGITFLRLLSLFLIVFNSILLRAIISNKDKPWVKQTKHIRYLIICDLIAALNLFWSVLLRFRNTPYWLCAIKTFLSSSTQLISYYHMLAVCIHRFQKLRKIDLPHGNNDKYRYGTESLFIWIVVLLLSVPPFVISARNEDLPVCRTDIVFRPDIVITSIYRLTLSCLPCFWTNVLYGALLWKIRVGINKIQPTNYAVRFRNTQNVANTDESSASVTKQQAVSITSSNKVNKVIGYLLLVLNISVLSPIISNALMLAGYEGVWIVLIQTLTYVNNIFNPFIYSLSIGPLRRELVSTFRALYSRVRAFITRTNA